MNISYEYQKPQNTWSLDQFISCKSDTTMSYHNLSFTDRNGDILYDTYNVISDYIDEIREYCVKVVLDDKQFFRYKYRPKLLCYEIYGNGELAFIIMIINDICSFKDFTKKKLFMPKREDMKKIIQYLFNANKFNIDKYNKNIDTTYQ